MTAPKLNATASQVAANMLLPIAIRTPYCFKKIVALPPNQQKRIVVVIEAAVMEMNATAETKDEMQLPQRLQMAKMPTTSSVAVTRKAMV